MFPLLVKMSSLLFPDPCGLSRYLLNISLPKLEHEASLKNDSTFLLKSDSRSLLGLLLPSGRYVSSRDDPRATQLCSKGFTSPETWVLESRRVLLLLSHSHLLPPSNLILNSRNLAGCEGTMCRTQGLQTRYLGSGWMDSLRPQELEYPHLPANSASLGLGEAYNYRKPQ